MTTCQKWFILIWMAVLSTLGGIALVVAPDTYEVTGYVFGAPLMLLLLWGLAIWTEENL